MKPALESFFSELLAVILGIVITFAVQGMIDRAQDRKNVRSALELVRVELSSHMDDISHLKDYLAQQRLSAKYLEENRDNLDACPEDIVRYHQGMVNADVSVALSHDALELLKNSSLFQKVGDNVLSLKIISAYDTCDQIVTDMYHSFTSRNAQSGDPSSWLLEHNPADFIQTLEIEDAIEAIDAYLKKR